VCSEFEEKGQGCFSIIDCWEFIKVTKISAAEQVCGRTEGSKRHEETCWWNEEVSVAVSKKKLLFRKWFKTRTSES